MPKPSGILNELLKYERVKRGWTQQEVASQVGDGVDARLVRRWEGGTTNPSPHHRERLAEVFDKRSPRTLGFPPNSEIPFWQDLPRRNPFFTGRNDILHLLHDTFLAQRADAVPRLPLALSGLGGVGKSQIALEYAYRYQDDYHTVLWVQAVSSQQLITGFTSIADLLCLPEKHAVDPDQTIAAVKQWLTDLAYWLLILDNADDLPLLERFLPSAMKGHVLLTTRSQSTGTLAHRSIPVEPLDDHAGAELLLRRAKILLLEITLEQAAPADAVDARSLAANMGGLPLALDQAGAYMEETGESLGGYRQLYQERRRALLNRRGLLQSSTQHPESVVATLELCFAKACKLHPLAGDMVRFCSLLQPDAVPEEVLLQAADLKLDTLSLNEAVAALQVYSLIKRNTHEKVFSMHRLVQEVIIESMDTVDANLNKQWRARVVQALNAVFPEGDFKDWKQCGRLIPHALVCAAWPEELFPALEAAALFHKAGVYLRERGQHAEAEPLLVQACSIRERHLGGEHLETAKSMHNLAILYRRLGKYERVAPLYQQVLSIYEQHLGAEHPDTASALNDLAVLYYNQGKYELAEPMYQRALAIREKQLGAEHPDTAMSLNSLAVFYWRQGKHEQAEPLYQQAIAVQERLLGAEHPDIAWTINSLAVLYHHQGKYEKAESLFTRAIAIREKRLGTEHPNTAWSLHGLANLSRDQGKHEQAEALYRQVLHIQEERLGAIHPHTQTTKRNYADFLRSVGREAEAEALESGDEPEA